MSAAAPKPPKSPLLGYLAADDRERRGWRLFVYLVLSYAIAFAAHAPFLESLGKTFVPAALPWAIAAGVAIWQHKRRLPFGPAWITLAVASTLFILPRLLLR